MTLIGITGGIGAGKSVVSRICRIKGFEVYDCDLEAKKIMDSSEGFKNELVQRCGKEVLMADSVIDRRLLSDKTFSDDLFRDWLNTTVHAMVREDIMRWVANLSEKSGCGSDICFVESAILHTSGLDRMCDRIWLVECTDSLRLERAMARGGISKENLLLRMKAQKAEFDRLPGEITDTLVNDGSESLLEQIEDLVNKI